MEGGKENTQPGQESGLARMFREGNKAIGTHKYRSLVFAGNTFVSIAVLSRA